VVKRIGADRCAAVLIDVQDFFLSQLEPRARLRIRGNLRNLARLLTYFRIPIVVTLERSVDAKGTLPKEIGKHLGGEHEIFEKDFFDLTKEKKIRDHLGRLRRNQVIIAGCETDVCVLQSCLGLLALGYEVFVVDDLLFSSSSDVGAAIVRMQAEGGVLLSYKSLYYELLEAVEGGRHSERMITMLGPIPADLPDFGVQ
jgi:nicotinamidase-related amidase